MTMFLYSGFISGKCEDGFGNGWTACDWIDSTEKSMIHLQQPEQQNSHWSIDDKNLCKQINHLGLNYDSVQTLKKPQVKENV